MSEWQPRDTCPNETTLCLVNSSWGVRVAFKHPLEWLGGSFQDALTNTDEGKKYWYGDHEGPFNVFHWMPLPSPPKEPELTPDTLPSKSEH